MLTTAYEFCAPKRSSSKRTTKAAYKRDVAVVCGYIRGVAFSLRFKCMAAAERVHAANHGSELILL